MKYSLHNFIKFTLAQKIHSVLDEEIDLESIYSSFGPTPGPDTGDLAFPCFELAKKRKNSPVKIAQELAQEFDSDSLFIDKVVAQGPYLNLFLKPSALFEQLSQEIKQKQFFNKTIVLDAPKTMVEFSQPNTHKEMHVGHMRNLCLGDALIKLYRYCSVPTHATTFPGDVGTHVAKCLWYLTHHNKEKAPDKRKGAWLGTLYTKGNLLLEEQKGTDREEQNRNELTQILKQIEQKSGEYYELWKETKQWSLELMQEVYEWSQVKFDSWYWESDVDSASLALVKDYYNKGLFIKDQGAIGIDLSEDKLGFCLLVKSDGTGLYATKDLELARRKFEEHQVDQSIYVVDNREARHFKQVFKTLEKMGFDKAKNCYHLQYEMVELPDGAMSSRKGNILPIQTLIDEMVNKIKSDYLNKYLDAWEEAEINSTANMIAAGAIKFGMNKIDPNKKIIFNMDEWLKLEGESGPYIQYVHARIQSMLKKLSEANFPSIAVGELDYTLLTHPSEKQLILALTQFNDVMEQAVKTYKTSLVCHYLYDVAKCFNQFYANCPVAKAESEALTSVRKHLCEITALVLRQGLALLGIEAPNRM